MAISLEAKYCTRLDKCQSSNLEGTLAKNLWKKLTKILSHVGLPYNYIWWTSYLARPDVLLVPEVYSRYSLQHSEDEAGALISTHKLFSQSLATLPKYERGRGPLLWHSTIAQWLRQAMSSWWIWQYPSQKTRTLFRNPLLPAPFRLNSFADLQ